jgi:hypothetical protein
MEFNMASGMTPAKRFAIRAALVSGSTVALIVGAQTLIAVDVQSGRMTQDGSTTNTISNTASSGITLLRQANPAPSVSTDDALQFNQQQQAQLSNTQQSFRRPRTHSSH